MNITLNSEDHFRVVTGCYDTEVLVRLTSLKNGSGLVVEQTSTDTSYLEVREKEGRIATFHFASKREKKYTDLGWWADAEVLFARNERSVRS